MESYPEDMVYAAIYPTLGLANLWHVKKNKFDNQSTDKIHFLFCFNKNFLCTGRLRLS